MATVAPSGITSDRCPTCGIFVTYTSLAIRLAYRNCYNCNRQVRVVHHACMRD